MSFQVSQQWTLGPRWQQLPGLRPPWVLYNCFFLTLLATNHAFHNLQFSCTSCLPESIQTERATSTAIFCIIGQCSSNTSKRTENVILRGSGNLGFVLLSPYSLEKTYALLGPRSPDKVAFLNISSVQSLSRVQLFAIPWTAACQASLSITNSRSFLKLTSIELVMPSNHLILCHPLLPLHSIFPSIRVLSNESVLCIRWPKYWCFSFSISPSNEYSGLISFWMDWLDFLAV